MCRGPRTGLLVIDAAPSKCRVCKLIIAPTFLDSHQEVCRLRLRALRAELRERQRVTDAAAASSSRTGGSPTAIAEPTSPHEGGAFTASSDDASMATASSAVALTEEQCLSCTVQKRAVALMPCGCFVLCSPCAQRTTQCPVCLQRVAARLTMFE